MTSHLPTPDRSPMVQVNIKKLIDEVQCYQTVRELRWPDGITCPSCQSKEVIKRGFDDTEPARQRYECHGCKPTVSLGVTYAVVYTYGCDDGRIAPTRCAVIAAGLDGR